MKIIGILKPIVRMMLSKPKLVGTPSKTLAGNLVISKRDVMLMSEKIEFVLNAANDVVHLITHDIT